MSAPMEVDLFTPKPEDVEKKHKHKHKDKHKHKHKDHHDKEKHKSHHHDKEKHKKHKHKHDHAGGSVLGKLESSMMVDDRLLSEPVDREIDGHNFHISDRSKAKDGEMVSPPKKRVRSSDVASVAIPGMKVQVDPKYLVPFSNGWKRELVLRNPENEVVITAASGKAAKADVYYYPPIGKKLRSLKEIETFLIEKRSVAGNVALDNFTWVKGAIHEPPDEVVREALGGRHFGKGGPGKQATPGTVINAVMKRADETNDWMRKKIKQAKKGHVPSFKLSGDKAGSLSKKLNFASSAKQVAKKATGASSGVAKKSTGNRPSRPAPKLCNFSCPGQEGNLPSLTCKICQGAYHPACVGITGPKPESYTCQTCLLPKPSMNGSHALSSGVMAGLQPNTPISGQLLTLPTSVLSKVNAQKPLSLRVNNQRLTISPNCFISTPEGIKVFLPTGTLPPAIFASENNATNLQLNVNKPKDEQGLKLISEMDKNGNSSETKKDPLETLMPKDSTCYLDKLKIGSDILLKIFHNLPHCDLIRAAQVCQKWKTVAEDPALWKTVCLKRARVSQWEEAANAFDRHGTETLDLREMMFYEDKNRTWHQLTSVLHQMQGIRKIYFWHSPAHMLHTISERLPDLEVLVAEQVFDADQTYKPTFLQTTKLDLSKFSRLTKLRELKVQSPNGICLPQSVTQLDQLSELKLLKKLSLITLQKVPPEMFTFLSSLPSLRDLELGDCVTFTDETYGLIGKLTDLKRLRLEFGGENTDKALSGALKQLIRLEELELMRFYIGQNMKNALGSLESLTKLSVWPDVGKQGAAVNTNTLNAVMELNKLKSMTWGIFVDEGSSVTTDDDDKENVSGEKTQTKDRIPFEPVGSEEGEEVEVEYNSLSQLKERLSGYLPDAKINVFRMPVRDAVEVVGSLMN